jgi:hypothetical protein
MELIRVDGEKTLYRDSQSTAIVNTDRNAYQDYLDTRNQKLQEKNEIETLKHDVADLKDMMRQLLEKL